MAHWFLSQVLFCLAFLQHVFVSAIQRPTFAGDGSLLVISGFTDQTAIRGVDWTINFLLKADAADGAIMVGRMSEGSPEFFSLGLNNFQLYLTYRYGAMEVACSTEAILPGRWAEVAIERRSSTVTLKSNQMGASDPAGNKQIEKECTSINGEMPFFSHVYIGGACKDRLQPIEDKAGVKFGYFTGTVATFETIAMWATNVFRNGAHTMKQNFLGFTGNVEQLMEAECDTDTCPVGQYCKLSMSPTCTVCDSACSTITKCVTTSDTDSQDLCFCVNVEQATCEDPTFTYQTLVNDACEASGTTCLNGGSCFPIGASAAWCLCQGNYGGSDCSELITHNRPFCVEGEPEFSLMCVKNNCDQDTEGTFFKNGQVEIIYKVDCQPECGDVEFLWTITGTGGSEVSLPGVNLNNQELYIPGEMLNIPIVLDSYSVSVTVSKAWTWKGGFNFVNVAPPSGGTCTIVPRFGTELETQFVITANRWAGALPELRYVFEEVLNGKKRMLLGEITAPINTMINFTTTLFPGKLAGDNDTVRIVCKVINKLGSSGVVNIDNITVVPTTANDAVQSAFDDFVSGKNTSRENSLQHAQQISSLLKGRKNAIDSTLKNEVAEALLNTLDSMENITVNQIPQFTFAASQAVAALDYQKFEQNSEQVKGQVKKVKEAFESNITTLSRSEMEQVGTSVVEVVSQVMQSGKTGLVAGGATSAFDPVKYSLNMADELNSLIETVADNVNIEEKTVEMKAGGITITAGKMTESDLNNVTLDSEIGNVNLELEDNDAAENDSMGCITFQSVFFDQQTQPYLTERPLEAEVNVAQFEIRECEGNITEARKKRWAALVNAYATQYFVDMIKPSQEMKVTPVSGMIVNNGDLRYHSLDLESPTNVHIKVVPVSDPQMYIYLGFNVEPTREEHASLLVTPDRNASKPSETQHDFVVTKEDIHKFNVTKLYMGIGQNCILPGIKGANCTTNFSYSFLLTGFKCSSWSSADEKWESRAQCEMFQETAESVALKPNKFGPVASLFLVPPNTLDFEVITSDFSGKLLESYEVWVTLSLCFVIFIIVLVYSRVHDNRDHIIWSVIALPDNQPIHFQTYEVHIHTGKSRSAGTEAKVSINIHGDHSNLGIRKLRGKSQDLVTYHSGSIKGFYLTCAETLGEVTHLEMYLDDWDKNHKWFLSYVVIVDLKHSKWYPFYYYDWVGADNPHTTAIQQPDPQPQTNRDDVRRGSLAMTGKDYAQEDAIGGGKDKPVNVRRFSQLSHKTEVGKRASIQSHNKRRPSYALNASAVPHRRHTADNFSLNNPGYADEATNITNNNPSPITLKIDFQSELSALQKSVLFHRNLLHSMVEIHLWVSTFYRAVKSTFTRVQRWVCCMFALFGYMLCGALWFDTSFGADSTDPEVGGFTIPVSTIVTTVYSTVIMSVLTAILAIGYEKTKISKEEENMHYMSYAPISQLRKNTVIPHIFIYFFHGFAILFILACIIVCVLFSLQWGPATSRVWLASFIFSLLLDVILIHPFLIALSVIHATFVEKVNTDLRMYHEMFTEEKH